MKRIILATILATGMLSATDFTSLSTTELIELKGTVAAEDREAFQTELQSRISTLSVEDREALGITPGGNSSYGAGYGTTAMDGSGIGSMGESAGGMGTGLGGGATAGGHGGGGHGKGGR